jgi:4-amino-4-deoxy-L-arabinose transferase-like glycosyltransferase
MSDRRRDLALPLALAAVTTLLHLLTARDGYGIFRDELYYVACSEHLSFGYVDQPPLIALITRFVRTLFGSSLTALRLVPALAAGGTVFLSSWMARELGGDRFAQALAGIAAALAPVYVGNFGYLSMNSIDVLLWAIAAFILMRLLRTGNTALWIPFGIVAGIGLQNKVSMLFLGFGLVVGLVLARQWSCFRTPRFWLGGLIAALIFLPHVIWQAVNGWPTLEFIDRATRYKNLPLAPLDFLEAQALMMNPLLVPLALAGLGFYLLSRAGRPYRALGWTFLVVLALMITQRAKPYYLAPSYTMLFSAGSVWLAAVTARRGLAWLRPATIGVVILSGAVLAPLSKPILPVESYVRACVFGQNYGHAGAIDYYGDELDLPTALSGHNSYHLWGPRDCGGEVMIVIDDDREDLERLFEHVELAANYSCEDCMPYEKEKPIWVCRGMRLPVETLWASLGHYD